MLWRSILQRPDRTRTLGACRKEVQIIVHKRKLNLLKCMSLLVHLADMVAASPDVCFRGKRTRCAHFEDFRF